MIRLPSLIVSIGWLLFSDPRASADPVVPPEIAGTWDVEHVEVDRADQMHWEYQPEDPRFLARELTISAQETRFSANKEGCKPSSFPRLSTTWADVFRKGFRRAPGAGRGTHPMPEDFHLPVSKQAKAVAYLLCPKSGRSAGEAWLEDEWVAVQGPDMLVMHEDPQILLILKRRAPDAKPRASFSCSEASSPTEKTICGSFELAGWDRSVAAAFRRAVERDPETRPKLLEQQKVWLHKRDACGADVACLDAILWRRVDDLIER